MKTYFIAIEWYDKKNACACNASSMVEVNLNKEPVINVAKRIVKHHLPSLEFMEDQVKIRVVSFNNIEF